jgi:hypothetical protein
MDFHTILPLIDLLQTYIVSYRTKLSKELLHSMNKKESGDFMGDSKKSSIAILVKKKN